MERSTKRYNNYSKDDAKLLCARRLEARKKAKIARCRQIAAVKCFIASLIMIIVVGVSSVLVVNASNKTEDKKCTRYYTSICVDVNDTLWSIAKEYHPDDCDISTYISDIKTINHITSDTIFAGQNIIIYYYEFEDLN